MWIQISWLHLHFFLKMYRLVKNIFTTLSYLSMGANCELLNANKYILGFIFRDLGAQWLSGRVLDSRPRVRASLASLLVSLSKNINPSLLLVQPRKTCPFITERWDVKNQIKQTNISGFHLYKV